VATFSQWLDAQSQRSDEVGRVALTWANAAPDGVGKIKRPRASAPKTIMGWFAAEPDIVPDMTPERVQDALIAAVAQYHQGSHVVGPALPSPPLGPDLQPKRLASVPDHQQADPPGDGVTAAQALPDAMLGVMADKIGALDERLAGLQELLTERDHAPAVAGVPPGMAEMITSMASTVAADHELLIAFMQAMAPVIELAAGLRQEGDDAIRAGIEGLGEQLGVDQAGYEGSAGRWAAGGGWLPSSPAVEGARQYVQQHWLPSQADGQYATGMVVPGWGDRPITAQEAASLNGGESQPDWAGGLCKLHCREDRCMMGCGCPGHQPDGTHVTQTRGVTVIESAADTRRRLPGGLYGTHIPPEPHMTRLYELGEAVDD
jgi:hypothetical protein